MSTSRGSLRRAVVDMLDGGPAVCLSHGAASPGPRVGAIVATSGSTGAAKRVLLSREALRASALAAQERVGALTWHLALPEHYVAGLMVVVRAVVAGRPVVVAAPDLSDLAATGEGDAISLVPTQLHRALADPDHARRLAAFDAVLVGGAGLEADLRERAIAEGIRVIETYGMSETCGGCVWDGLPLPGVDVEVLAHDGVPDGAGRITLAGAMLFEGYQGEPQATEAVVRDGRFYSSDWGRLVGGRLSVAGRIDDVVITGGVNVDLRVVRLAASALDPETAVLAVDDAEWGCRIVLFAPSGTLETWREALSPALARAALPRQFVSLPSLPRTAGGKPDRAALLAALQWASS